MAASPAKRSPSSSSSHVPPASSPQPRPRLRGGGTGTWTGADWWSGATGGSPGSLGLGAAGMARAADGGDCNGVAEDAAAAAAAMVALRRSRVPAETVAAEDAVMEATPPRPGSFMSPSWSAARRPRWRGTRPGSLEASGGGSEGKAGAEKRRSPSRSSSPAEGEEAGMEGDGEEKRPRKRSAGGERRGLPAASIWGSYAEGRRGSGSGGKGLRFGALRTWRPFAALICRPMERTVGPLHAKNTFRAVSKGKKKVLERVLRNNYNI
jgi:hypothetical protein